MIRALFIIATTFLAPLAGAMAAGSGLDFKKEVLPLLEDYCYDCHGDGADKGGFKLDENTNDAARLSDHVLWLKVWDNLRAQMMPPLKKRQPSTGEREKVMRWIERDVFKVDPENPDPGRVTIRRLNRKEYEYTIKDLLGVEFEADEEFPPDDTGYGFDTIGDVLSISPLLLEKYLAAAEKIVGKAVPTTGPRIPMIQLGGDSFRDPKHPKSTAKWLPFETASLHERRHTIPHAGRYRIRVEMQVAGSMGASSHSAVLALRANGKQLETEDLSWDNRKSIYLTGEADLRRGVNTFGLQMQPKAKPEDGENPLRLAVRSVYLQGPLSGEHRRYPSQYLRVFTDGPPPDDVDGRRVYAKRILRQIASRAFRRPVDEPTLNRLVKMAIHHDQEEGIMFEKGIGHAITALLSSPRFLFRAEIQSKPNDPGEVVAVDEFALASRLSYFLWSSLPDKKLMELAAKGELRKDLRNQIDRMIEDPKSGRFIRNFVGQWLQTRDVEAIHVDPRRILKIRDSRQAYRVFNNKVRSAMRAETEMMFRYLIMEDRSALDLLIADYTFLNRTLAKFYGIDDVRSDRMEKVTLPADSRRSGILTHGSVLLVTSNPTRTSPVKRGLFVLENLMGTPPPPAPPNVPELEEAVRGKGRTMTMREAMAVHRENPLCASCHERFDPLGLALENFNALGMWRDEQNGKKIETEGQLITGEKFADAKELGKVLATKRRPDFYRCLTEKLLTYALGRGMEYYDTPTIDRIAKQLDADKGRMRSLIYLMIESAPFQKRRGDGSRLLAH